MQNQLGVLNKNNSDIIKALKFHQACKFGLTFLPSSKTRLVEDGCEWKKRALD